MNNFFIFFVLTFFSLACLSETEHTLLRRVVMFPIQLDSSMKQVGEESWLAMRKLLVENKRILLASRRFMQDKNVLQARSELLPSDAIILAKILDAQGVIVTYLRKKTLHMRVYDGEYGRPLWFQHIDLDTYVQLKKQIKKASLRLLNNFIASIPYQGSVVVDPLVGTPVYRSLGKNYTKIDFGFNSQVKLGDSVQFIRVSSDRLDPLFSGVENLEVFAEGKIVESDGRFFSTEITRFISLSGLKEDTLVRVPKEFQRLQKAYGFKSGELSGQMNLNYLSSNVSDSEIKEENPLVSTISFFMSLALYLLIAL